MPVHITITFQFVFLKSQSSFSEICPKSFDILTIGENPNRRTIRLTTGHFGGILQGHVLFSFAGDTVKIPVDADAIACEDALSRLNTVSKTICRRENYDAATGTGSFRIEFVEYPLYSAENNLNFHDGNPLLSLFYCNNTAMDDESAVSPYCDVEDVSVSNLPGKRPQTYKYIII